MSCQAGQPKSQNQSGAKEPAVSEPAAGTKDKLVVCYFHGNARCPTCYKLENFAKSAVESDFADQIRNGKIEWKTINVEDAGNEHFTNDYKLYTKSVIISIQKDGKEVSWKNLDRIWQLVGDQDKYTAYIDNEVRACLEGKCL